MKDTLLQLLDQFINDEISQSTYVDRHDKVWHDVKELSVTNPEKLGKLLMKLDLAYRRKALFQAFNLSQDELRTLLLGVYSKSSSTIGDLFDPKKKRRHNDKLLAKLSIIFDVPFNWVCQEGVRNRWNIVSYEILGDVISLDDLKEQLKLAEGEFREIDGYIVESAQNQDLFIRLERRSNVIVLRLNNSNSHNVEALQSVLQSSSFFWYGAKCSSVLKNHEFYTWIGAADEEDIYRVFTTEYNCVGPMIRLC